MEKDKYCDTTINNIFVIHIDNRDSKSRKRYLVRCHCGNEYVTLLQAVKRSIKGCKKCASRGERPHRRKRPFEYQYNNFVYRARYPVSITYEDYLEFTKQTNCHYCNSPIIWSPYRKGSIGNGSNLDRKNNDVGYTIENCVVCCGRCNYAKGSHFSYEEWLQIGQTIKTFPKRDYKVTPQSNSLFKNPPPFLAED